MPEHSPLGGSGAYRWMACPGSVELSEGIVEEDSDFALEGLAAHAVVREALTNGVSAAFFTEGSQYLPASDTIYCSDSGVPITQEMAKAAQFFIDEFTKWHPFPSDNSFIEYKFNCPSIHRYFFGQADAGYISHDYRTLDIWDYKHGAGVVVEVKDNPQCYYYASGILESLSLWGDIDTVRIHIVQPRAWHADGPHRVWEVSRYELAVWLEDECIPAMDRALASDEVNAGEHCRFCPARGYQCPAMMAILDELQELLSMPAEEYTNEQIVRILELQSLSKIAFKAVQTRAYQLLQSGKAIDGVKLVNGRANREFKKGAFEAARKEFGLKCMTSRELKSPAQMEALPDGLDFVARWAFKPQGKLVVALEKDARKEVTRDHAKLFKPVRKK